MARPLDQIEKEVMSLPPRERATLVEHILATLDVGEDADAEEAWLAEAERRYQAYRAGKIQASPAAEAFKRARRELE